MNNIIKILVLALIVSSCGNGNNKSDAYGNFEAKEIQVSAEAQGKITDFKIEEGDNLKAGQIAGYIDTAQLYLKKMQLQAQVNSLNSKFTQISSQIAVQEQQKASIEREQKRLEKLVAANAAPTKQLDDINSQLDVLNSQIASTKVQNQSITFDTKAMRFQIEQMQDQIDKSSIVNPVDGTVLEKYVEQGEMATPGKVLYKIADLSVLRLRAYISESQLSQIKVGQKVTVLFDKKNDKMQSSEGIVSWVSQQAEFTPKIIQTKEERVNLVYAIKVDVKNNGALKIGMPGEIRFTE
jgi:HlyD family secretion protein